MYETNGKLMTGASGVRLNQFMSMVEVNLNKKQVNKTLFHYLTR